MSHHSLAWLAWTLAAAVSALTIRNPLYLAIIALACWLVYMAEGRGSALARSWGGLIRLGALVWLFTIPFNALMLHQGERVLFRLPDRWPLVGGNITLEAVVHGGASGLAIWVLLVIFSVFNVCVDASQLLRLAPPFLYQAGVVTSIALTFMPQMLLSAREIREAQRIRGHRFRSWRDLLPLIAPLLTTSLEHAIQLAESMESRGFGGQLTDLTPRSTTRWRLLMLFGLGLLLCGLFVYTYRASEAWLGVLLMILGGLSLLYLFRSMGRSVQRSRYRRARWRRCDSILVALSATVLVVTMLIRASDKLALSYYPFSPYPMAPEFNPWIGALLALLAVPGVAALLSEPDAEDAR